MAFASTTLSAAQRKLLERLCARNQSIELHYTQDGVRRTARAQLMELTDDLLLISRPQAIGSMVVLCAGGLVNVYVLDHGEMFSFQTRVHRGMMRVRLNAEKMIPGSALLAPTRLERQQRRSRYRVPVTRHNITVALHELCDAEEMCTPLGARECEGLLTNISGGGFAATFELRAVRWLGIGAKLFASFQLPDCDWYFGLPVEIRHMRRTKDESRIVMGFAIQHRRDPYVYAQMCEIDQFAADEQRRRLRRRSANTSHSHHGGRLQSRLRRRRRGLR